MPQTTDLPVGEVVDVKLRSAVIVSQDPMVVRVGDEEVTVPAGGAGIVDIEVVAPLNWPPVEGDVWVDGNSLKWFAVKIPVGDPPEQRVRLVAENSTTPQNPNTIKNTNRPLTLEYRTA